MDNRDWVHIYILTSVIAFGSGHWICGLVTVGMAVLLAWIQNR